PQSGIACNSVIRTDAEERQRMRLLNDGDAMGMGESTGWRIDLQRYDPCACHPMMFLYHRIAFKLDNCALNSLGRFFDDASSPLRCFHGYSRRSTTPFLKNRVN
ncbi:MAG TPA: hypothetical protein VIU43_00670, partial [Nitrosospira sp.]